VNERVRSVAEISFMVLMCPPVVVVGGVQGKVAKSFR
jgi:hypothetical protein